MHLTARASARVCEAFLLRQEHKDSYRYRNWPCKTSSTIHQGATSQTQHLQAETGEMSKFTS